MLGEMDLNPPSKSKNKTITRAIVLFLDFFDLGGAFVETVENDVQYIQKQGKKRTPAEKSPQAEMLIFQWLYSSEC